MQEQDSREIVLMTLVVLLSARLFVRCCCAMCCSCPRKLYCRASLSVTLLHDLVDEISPAWPGEAWRSRKWCVHHLMPQNGRCAHDLCRDARGSSQRSCRQFLNATYAASSKQALYFRWHTAAAAEDPLRNYRKFGPSFKVYYSHCSHCMEWIYAIISLCNLYVWAYRQSRKRKPI